MAARLLAAGHEVHLFNRGRNAAVEALATRGALIEASAAEVARKGEVVLAALPVPEASEDVFAEMAAVAQPGQMYVDHSTVSPSPNCHCAGLLAARGAAYLAAPVSGGPSRGQASDEEVRARGCSKRASVRRARGRIPEQ